MGQVRLKYADSLARSTFSQNSASAVREALAFPATADPT